MTPEELDEALRRGAWVTPPKPATAPSPTRPVSESLGCSDAHAATMARALGLIDAEDRLHCWSCGEPCDWHVSLHCAGCRLDTIRNEPERQRQERARQKLARQHEQQQQSQPQRVANRSFRDGY